jgi:lysine 2,3-aminomutase
MAFEIKTINNVAERFKPAPRPAVWKDVDDKDWNNWIWQQQKRIKSMEQLEKVIPPTQEERDAFAQSHEMFNMGITPYYASLMDGDNPNCPIRLQSVPKKGELMILPTDLEDPLGEERDMPVPGITHRYPDRVLLFLPTLQVDFLN